MKKEYDFSKGGRGKFHIPDGSKVKLPRPELSEEAILHFLSKDASIPFLDKISKILKDKGFKWCCDCGDYSLDVTFPEDDDPTCGKCMDKWGEIRYKDDEGKIIQYPEGYRDLSTEIL